MRRVAAFGVCILTAVASIGLARCGGETDGNADADADSDAPSMFSCTIVTNHNPPAADDLLCVQEPSPSQLDFCHHFFGVDHEIVSHGCPPGGAGCCESPWDGGILTFC